MAVRAERGKALSALERSECCRAPCVRKSALPGCWKWDDMMLGSRTRVLVRRQRAVLTRAHGAVNSALCQVRRCYHRRQDSADSMPS